MPLYGGNLVRMPAWATTSVSTRGSSGERWSQYNRRLGHMTPWTTTLQLMVAELRHARKRAVEIPQETPRQADASPVLVPTSGAFADRVGTRSCDWLMPLGAQLEEQASSKRDHDHRGHRQVSEGDSA